jgi:hypothetical protein
MTTTGELRDISIIKPFLEGSYMPRMSMSVPHALPQAEALSRMQAKAAAMFREYAEQLHNVQEAWTDYAYAFSFAVMGMAIQGTVLVEAAQVTVGAQVPLVALPFRGMIEKEVREQLTKLLG